MDRRGYSWIRRVGRLMIDGRPCCIDARTLSVPPGIQAGFKWAIKQALWRWRLGHSWDPMAFRTSDDRNHSLGHACCAQTRAAQASRCRLSRPAAYFLRLVRTSRGIVLSIPCAFI
jgi:hypothetical protein